MTRLKRIYLEARRAADFTPAQRMDLGLAPRRTPTDREIEAELVDARNDLFTTAGQETTT